jgi:bifunctional non-homologous end joining protein LigD
MSDLSPECAPKRTSVEDHSEHYRRLGGDDLRQLPLKLRKTNLAQLLARRSDGIFVAPFEQGEIGPELFTSACRMGLEELVSKNQERAYRGGRCGHWVKVKNHKHPAYSRVRDQF